MSTCAVVLVKDELDVVEPLVRHLLANVDEVEVSDNLSTDGTYDRLLELASRDDRLVVRTNEERGYYQAEVTTARALAALERGHEWVVPCDADELWFASDGRRIADYLAGFAPDVGRVRALLYNHLPTALDPEDEPNPFRRIGWRQRQHQEARFGKVAARLRPDLRIEQGNHAISTEGVCVEVGGLEVRHFSWRSAEQYERKIANGFAAYAASDLPESMGAHWRMHGDPAAPDFGERVRAHFYQWFWSPDPEANPELVYAPAPLPKEEENV